MELVRRSPFWFVTGAVFLLQILLRPDLLLLPQFWAEDATKWFYDAYTASRWWQPYGDFYGGYPQTLPRIIGTFCTVFLPVQCIPLAMNVAALTVSSVSLGFFSHPCFRKVISSDVIRSGICLCFVLKNPSTELFGTITNVHWFLLTTSVLLTTLHFSSKRAREAARGFILLSSFSSPNMIIAVPIILALLYLKEGEKGIQATFLVGVILQFFLIKFWGAPPHYSLHEIVAAIPSAGDFLSVALLSSFVGVSSSYWLFQSFYTFSIIISLGLFCVMMGMLWYYFPNKKLLIGCAAFSLFSYTLLTVIARKGIFIPLPSSQLLNSPTPNFEQYNHSRYLYPPFFLCWLAIGCLLGPLRRTLSLSLLSIAVINGGVQVNSFGPLPYLHWDRYAKRIERGEEVLLPIHPSPWGWNLKIPARLPLLPQLEIPLAEELAKTVDDPHVNLRMVNISGTMQLALFEHASFSLRHEVEIKKNYLTFLYGLDPRSFEHSDGVEFGVSVEEADNKKVVFRKKVVPKSGSLHRAWQRGTVDLSLYKGKKVVLNFWTDQLQDGGYDWALWVEPLFVDHLERTQ